MSGKESMGLSPVVAVWDVDWVDTHGAAKVCGFLLPQADVHDRVKPGDRTGTGRLTAAAKERIAAELTVYLRQIATNALSHGPPVGAPIVLRDCHG